MLAQATYLTMNHMQKLDKVVYRVKSPLLKVLKVSCPNIQEYLKTRQQFDTEIEIEEFLRENIAEFATSSRATRQNLIKSFEVHEICNGVYIFREGEMNDSAYIIMSGEVQLLKKSFGSKSDKD